MPESNNLNLEQGSTPKALPNRRSKGENDHEHGIGKLSFSRLKFNWLNTNRVFDRDSPKCRTLSVHDLPHDLVLAAAQRMCQDRKNRRRAHTPSIKTAVMDFLTERARSACRDADRGTDPSH